MTSLSKDVVSRLRGERACNTLGHTMLMHEAADEIERLTRCAAEVEMMALTLEGREKEIDRLRREIVHRDNLQDFTKPLECPTHGLVPNLGLFGNKCPACERDRLRAALEQIASGDIIQGMSHELFASKVLDGGAHETTGSRTNDEATLRGLLAAVYSGSALYRDDGQLQDNSERPFIDYLHDSVREIERKITERGHCKLTASVAVAPMMRGDVRAPHWSLITEALESSEKALVVLFDMCTAAGLRQGAMAADEILGSVRTAVKQVAHARGAQEATGPQDSHIPCDRSGG